MLPVDALLRISAVLGVHKSLAVLFGSDHEALEWLRGPHHAAYLWRTAADEFAHQWNSGWHHDRPPLPSMLFAAGSSAAPDGDDQDAAPYTDDDIVIA